MIRTYTTLTSDTNLDYNYDIYNIDASLGSINITLPEITGDGQSTSVKRIDTNPNNTVTVSGFGGQTIDSYPSVILNINGSINPVANSNGTWFLNSGERNDITGPKNDLNLKLRSSGIPPVSYFVVGTTAFIKVDSFIYRGSSYYGRIPVLFTISFSLDSGTTDTSFTVRLVDNTNVQEFATLTTTATTDNTTILTATSSAFTNVSESEAVIEIQTKLSSTGPPNIRLYSVYIQFN